MHRLISTLTLAGSLAVLSAGSTTAHSVWIEPTDDGQLRVRFAEPDGKLEKSPGHLDSLTPPMAFSVGTGTNDMPVQIDAPKHSDHFALRGARPDQSVGLETAFGVMAAPGRPGRRPNFYARWHPAGWAPASPRLTLDLVPTGKSGQVRVYFRGRPLPAVDAVLRTPEGKETPVKADTEGLLEFSVSGPGLYHLSIGRHRETLPGFLGGRAYELTSHNVALTWEESDSAAPAGSGAQCPTKFPQVAVRR